MIELLSINERLVKKGLAIPQMLCISAFIFIVLRFCKGMYPDFPCALRNTELIFFLFCSIQLLRKLQVLKDALLYELRFKHAQHLYLLLLEITIIMPTYPPNFALQDTSASLNHIILTKCVFRKGVSSQSVYTPQNLAHHHSGEEENIIELAIQSFICQVNKKY